ncbi:trehalose-phosphatase [Roseitranquillus sediminis]|uniref:trehalose-phosphatase n=1 Tax=Roseitranquillus sediminis TaxID=2809051 RepID=UPI001D0CCF8E|nr:trehalose-phosphatase [Roseitranquillus sediminis]MBM9593452.1 trehalose-phosphatase [Roseitranquillus sediminis]
MSSPSTQSGKLPDRPDLGRTAIFLDFDGTLVGLAETPDAIDVPADLPERLNDLRTRSGGALAIISGRSVEAIERHLSGYAGDVVGSHGAERRIDGHIERHRLAGSPEVDELKRAVREFADRDEAYLVEDKPAGVVLHFRRKPELQSDAEEFMRELCRDRDDFKLQPAKMAYELKPRDTGKIASVEWLMQRTPYEGRQPCYFGDDDTDEAAMRWVNEAGGFAVKVGEGDTCAAHRLDGVEEVRATLARWADAR